MKDQKRKRSDVVPLKTQPAPPAPLYPLAMEVGELRTMCEKLLYRIQQLERREKTLISGNRSLRREVTALKKLRTQPVKTALTVQSKPAVSNDPSPPRPLSESEPSMESFHSAMDELNNLERH